MTRPIRMQAFIGGLAVALLLLTQGACTNTITGDNRYAFYHPDLVRYVAAQGDFPVLIIANPFGAGLDGALLATMQLPGFYAPAAFKATTAEARKDGHLVLIFNPIRTSTGDAACSAPLAQTASAAPAGAANNLRLQAAFCYGRDAVSVAYLEMPRPRGFNDPAFGEAMSQLLAVLLPSQIPDQGGCSDPAGLNC
ncbi:MAG: hypothetical protein ISR50_17845 [Alphaproteobacteria bacterium]|nr:hypothetical protein [Alphaproteobacteria bacterium]